MNEERSEQTCILSLVAKISLYVSLSENDPPSHLIHHLSKWFPNEVMVSNVSLKISSIQHGVLF